MKYPHVKALHYQVIAGKGVDYNNAAPLSETTDGFDLSLDGKIAIFEMKEHYSTANEAKAVVEQYLQAWDILIGLEQNPGNLQLVFDHADIIDLSPDRCDESTLNFQAYASDRIALQDRPSAHISRGKYPSFPKKFSASPDAETMYLRYKAYQQNRETLTSMAYMCLTILQATASGRKKAARQYGIDYAVLDTLGKLVSTKGDAVEARKFPKDGIFEPLRPTEKDWVILVIKALIRRVGEYAHDPKATLKKLYVEGFPDLATP